MANGTTPSLRVANAFDQFIFAQARVGRWTSEYTLLRGVGRVHMFPGDDVGARNNLRRWLRLRKPLDYEGVRRVLAGWGGYAGLVYFHLLLDRLGDAGYLSETSSQGRDASVNRQQRLTEA
jgi:hypothetical protein